MVSNTGKAHSCYSTPVYFSVIFALFLGNYFMIVLLPQASYNKKEHSSSFELVTARLAQPVPWGNKHTLIISSKGLSIPDITICPV